MCGDVAMLRIYPSIMASSVRHFLQLPVRGVVLQCYGSGNIPSNRADLLEAVREAASGGVMVLVVTQCSHGGVSGDYETGQALLDTGAVPGSDITQVPGHTAHIVERVVGWRYFWDYLLHGSVFC